MNKLIFWITIITIFLFVPCIKYEIERNDGTTIITYKSVSKYLHEMYKDTTAKKELSKIQKSH